jgi:hypothetical protein
MVRHTIVPVMFAAALLFGVVDTAHADEKADPTGEWAWTFSRGDQEFELVLDLKLDGEELTGTLNLADRFTLDISEGKFEDGELSFQTEFERNGTTRVTKYSGKVEGDTIKGKTERERDGETRSRDWEAKRVE